MDLAAAAGHLDIVSKYYRLLELRVIFLGGGRAGTVKMPFTEIESFFRY